MINGLKPYPELKDSGVEWLGEVPAHWQVVMVKQNYPIQLGKMLQPRPNTLQDVEIPYLKAQHVQWFHVRTTDVPKMWAGQKDIAQFGVASGDLLVCEGGEGGRCGILRQDVEGYIIQNALHRVRSREQSRNDYLQYVMSSVAATGWFDALNNKATIAHFTKEKFGALRVPVPPPPEQTAIVRFLDYADRRIRHYIRAKQKLIALLEEQKQAIIHQAVAGQIDVRTGQPYPAYKPSGVEWLGDVPAHWGITRLKTALSRSTQNGLFKKKDQFGHGVPLINVADVYRERFHVDPSSLQLVQASPDELQRFQVKAGDIFFVRSSLKLEGTGRSAIAISCSPDTVFECHLVQARPDRQRVNPQYLVTQLNSYSSRHNLISRANMVTIATIAQDTVSSCPVVIPPRLEQDSIVQRLDTQWNRISRAIERANQEVALLREYRTRLIADVVTGKLDVREAATALPEVDPLVAEDDLDNTFDMGADSALDELDATLGEIEA